jgi:hypothetical protein
MDTLSKIIKDTEINFLIESAQELLCCSRLSYDHAQMCEGILARINEVFKDADLPDMERLQPLRLMLRKFIINHYEN